MKIDHSVLPHFTTAKAINLSYTEACVRLANAMSLGSFIQLEKSYRVTVKNPESSEVRFVVLKNQGTNRPCAVPFPDVISMLAILRLKHYFVTYGINEVAMSISGQGDMDRIYQLFNSRPEFSQLDLSEDMSREVINGEAEESKETALPAPEASET